MSKQDDNSNTGDAPRTGIHQGLTSYGDDAFSLYMRRVFIKAMGYSDDALTRPIIGIADTGSDYNACHGGMPQLVEAVKRGVMLAGGMPMAFPTITIHESFAHPTSMFLRNLMAIDTEEMIRAQPMDAIVLIGGCDKTVPAQLMAAASANIPAIVVVTGPMMTGRYQGERLGACTDCRRLWGAYRAGELDDSDMDDITGRLAPTIGTCMVMGTASTMACMTEALGMMMPGGATIPAVNADRLRVAEQSGARAVELAAAGPKPSEIMTAAAFRNALVTLQAIGGSTNGLIHITAVARRLGIEIDLDEFDRIGRDVPVLIDLKPSGEHYMENLNESGGLNAVLRELRPHLALDALTVTGRPLGENIELGERVPAQNVIRTPADPISATGGLAVLRGNLAPGGAIIKHSAASAELLSHRGRAVVFESLEDLARRVDDPDLEVDADSVLVLKNAGPKGAPGMPEAGYLPIPKKLGRRGVRDMVRISDARMSGTAFGTIVLHVTPESNIGGPLGLVETGDWISLDVAARRLELEVDADVLEARRKAWTPPPAHAGSERGYLKLYLDTVLQADQGCDFDFM
ncbi:MAG: dihydroxy-acid dehydratase [Alphaproteobacteria bacterium]|nr:dihydroxy-acid dehydratase [Alphaproteobacteria bacterium]